MIVQGIAALQLGNADGRVPATQWLVSRELAPAAQGLLAVETILAEDSIPAHQLPAVETATLLLDGQVAWVGHDPMECLLPGEGVYSPPGSVQGLANADAKRAVLLVAYGGTTDPTDIARQRVAVDTASTPAGPEVFGRRVLRAAESGVALPLEEQGGFVEMGVRWLVTSETVGARLVAIGTSTFTPGGRHELHRHSHAQEFLLILAGGGNHLTEAGEVRLDVGDLVVIPAGEWHGFCTDPGVTTRTVFGYLGAGNLEQAGYELRPEG
jgi:quercetin dioxygenase-like cupin family protein